MRAWADRVGLHQGIGDLEAEILYMRLREARPQVCHLRAQHTLPCKFEHRKATLSKCLGMKGPPPVIMGGPLLLQVVVELGFGQGLATTYMLKALHDNGVGELHTFDLKDSKNRQGQIETIAPWTLCVPTFAPPSAPFH